MLRRPHLDDLIICLLEVFHLATISSASRAWCTRASNGFDQLIELLGARPAVGPTICRIAANALNDANEAVAAVEANTEAAAAAEEQCGMPVSTDAAKTAVILAQDKAKEEHGRVSRLAPSSSSYYKELVRLGRFTSATWAPAHDGLHASVDLSEHSRVLGRASPCCPDVERRCARMMSV